MSQQTPSATSHGGPWPKSVPDIVWSPVVCFILMLVPGLLGWALRLPWLFPSLGPTACIHAQTPQQPSAKPYNTIVGHLLGIIAGYLIVFLLSPSPALALFKIHHVTMVTMWAAVLSVTLTMFLQLALKAYHAPAAATTLLISMGGFRPLWKDALSIAAGVLIVAILGEVLRRARLGWKEA